MKKKPNPLLNYIPLLIAVITVMGTIIGGVLAVISNSKAVSVELEWIKKEVGETKAEIVNLKHSIDISDENSADIFKEILDRLEGYRKAKKGGK